MLTGKVALVTGAGVVPFHLTRIEVVLSWERAQVLLCLRN